ncbi:hypothetical protein O0I10_007116 [Lichtheimia ornata]|uniref:Carotene oxygenase n=1 Tax=Lichtheimia ornata TaxID=688661 RepID=A0AAD7V315_9FUNG|nr:uncharacterized protein O0I10_007116 [Lichtheimia ornata]KAJ8657300.1 hypothetical protein O0I10_007116 [Lichtheimia ornata]
MGVLDYLRASSIVHSIQQYDLVNTPEFQKPVWLPVSGTIPPWLNGILYRIGPAKYNLGDQNGKQYMIRHAFDGLPFIHRFELCSKQQKVRYNSRLTAEAVEKTLVSGNSNNIFFGHMPDEEQGWGRFAKTIQRLDSTLFRATPQDVTLLDPSSRAVGVTVTPNYPLPKALQKADSNDRVLVAKSDYNMLQQVNEDTLEPQLLFEYNHYDKKNLHGIPTAAHHQYDAETGETFNVLVNFGRVSKMTIFALDHTGTQTRVLAEITHRKLANGDTSEPILLSYIHSFWLTKHYVIIPESPLHYGNRGLDVLMSGTIVTGLAWKKNTPTYLHIISRDTGGLLVSLPTDPFFTFHTANAWDTIDDKTGQPVIHLDCCAFDSADFLYKLYNLGQRDATESTKDKKKTTPIEYRGITIDENNMPTSHADLRRYSVTWGDKENKATSTTITPNVEFPRFSQAYTLKPYQFLWGCQASEDDPSRSVLCKVDLDTGHVTRNTSKGYSFSEPIFAPRPDATSEDDGVLLSFVNNVSDHRCLLVIVDASTLEEIATCDVGDFTATTFHGSFVSDKFENISVN